MNNLSLFLIKDLCKNQMEKITVSFNNQNKPVKGKTPKKEKIILTYHPFQKEIPEKLTYFADGKEVEFTDTTYTIIRLSQNKTLAKKTLVEKVSLDFVPERENVEAQEGYFTYKDSEERFLDDVRFDEELNSYIGTITKVNTYDNEIKLFE